MTSESGDLQKNEPTNMAAQEGRVESIVSGVPRSVLPARVAAGRS
jgi:hypothetical protein